MVVELTEGAQDVEADLKEPGAQQSQATAKDNPGGTAEEKNVRKFSLPKIFVFWITLTSRSRVTRNLFS